MHDTNQGGVSMDHPSYIDRVLEIAKRIGNCDFRVLTAVYSSKPHAVICVGESFWSRCLMVENTDKNDPFIKLLIDDGSNLAIMCLSGGLRVERELPLSELISGGYMSVKQSLDSEKHKNGRLAF